MVVETAKIRDLDELLQMGEAFQQESPLHGVQKFDLEKTKRFATHMITADDHCAFLARSGDKLHGFIAGGLRSMYYSKDKYLSEYVYFVTPNSRGSVAAKGLIDAFCKWGKEKGAKAAELGISTAINPERADRFMKKVGFKYMGANFYKEL
jgi:GNAT superfamily N-acetyltransferase